MGGEGGGNGTGGTKELRLALVCYGGVSLAIYMYGVTREIQELVVASKAWERGETNPFAPTDSKHAYYEALRRRSNADGVRAHVVVDVISGASAGGIDGVFLAKALAEDLSQAALKDLWLELGDIGKLLRGFGPLPLRAAWFGLTAAVRGGNVTSPLKGDDLARWLYDALAEMKRRVQGEDRSTLVPPGQTLELFVTVTDARGYERFIAVSPGDPIVRDRTHRHVLHFSHPHPGLDPGASDRAGQFGSDYNGALAFAARATSSFPGAFPPLTLDQFRRALAKCDRSRRIDFGRLKSEFFKEYVAWGDDPFTTWFMDGGLLDNFPFGHAIDAIERKPANSEVERTLLYIEPDPSPTPPAGTSDTGPVSTTDPGGLGWLKSIGRALSIPSHEPVLDDLIRLRNRNERINQVNELTEACMPAVDERLTEVAQGWRTPEQLTYEDVLRLTRELHAEAHKGLGLGLGGYLRLRLQSIAASISDAVAIAFAYPKTSSQASFVRESCRLWLTSRYKQLDEETGRQFFSTFDVPFRERRLRFVIQGINRFYGRRNAPPRADLDGAKEVAYRWMRTLWSLPDELRQSMSEAAAELFGAEVLKRWMSENPEDFLKDNKEPMERFEAELQGWLTTALEGFGVGLWQAFHQRTAGFGDEARSELLARYLGFPLWDALVYPVLALSGVEQFSPIRVRRLSPLDATALRWPPEEKLKGSALHHFAAFFGRERRENDYLWGRLDAVEMLLCLVDPATSAQDLSKAFTGVLDDEQPALRTLDSSEAGSFGRRLRDAVAALAASPATGGVSGGGGRSSAARTSG